MALDIAEVKDELASLKEKRANLDRKIEGLEHYLGQRPTSDKNGSSLSARGGIDIRPAIEAVFQENGNQPMRLKNIEDAVGIKHPELDRVIIHKKMVHPTRTILEQVSYGQYRLKQENSP